MHNPQSTMHEHCTALHADRPRPRPTPTEHARTHARTACAAPVATACARPTFASPRIPGEQQRARERLSAQPVLLNPSCSAQHSPAQLSPAQPSPAEPALLSPSQPSPSQRSVAFKASDAARPSEHARVEIALAGKLGAMQTPSPPAAAAAPRGDAGLLGLAGSARTSFASPAWGRQHDSTPARQHANTTAQCARVRRSGRWYYPASALLLHGPVYDWTQPCGGLAGRGRVLQDGDAALPDFFRVVYKAFASSTHGTPYARCRVRGGSDGAITFLPIFLYQCREDGSCVGHRSVPVGETQGEGRGGVNSASMTAFGLFLCV